MKRFPFADPMRSLNCFQYRLCVASCVLLLAGTVVAEEPSSTPVSLDPALTIELVTAEPEIVTPICCRLDSKGRLLVVESHTHQVADSYNLHPNDRIRIIDDSDGDGRLDRTRTFFEAGRNTMGIAIGPDDWVYVSSRSEVYRIADRDNDDVAETREQILTLDTDANYPHNGLGVITFAVDGSLVVGMGENFGAHYQLKGTDGSVQTGSGEGGNIFRCSPTGGEVERIATGIWNPFGLSFDAAGRLWTVDNDPDASPPCRILHVVETGDYGFQFRFGRSGTSPLQSWDGNLPGTLPMTGGTGEAPCAVVPWGRSLLVTSWGDNRIELHTLHSTGAAWEAQMTTLVQGGPNFRPVDLTVASPNSMYLTDWVDREYAVHGKGRIWKLTWNHSQTTAESPTNANHWPLQVWEKRAQLLSSGDLPDRSELLTVVQQSPFLAQAVVAGAVEKNIDLDLNDPAEELRLAAYVQRRWLALTSSTMTAAEIDAVILQGLQDASTEVRNYCIRWAASLDRADFIDDLEQIIAGEQVEPSTAKLALAGLSYLQLGSFDPNQQRRALNELLVTLALDEKKSAALRTVAVNALPDDSQVPSNDQLRGLIESTNDDELRDAAMRLLIARPVDSAAPALSQVVENNRLSDNVRADALAALPANELRQELIARVAPKDGPLRQESLRLVESANQSNIPPVEDLDAWLVALGSDGDWQAGRRVFNRSACRNCHAYQGRGARIGPDLTGIGKTMDRRKLLEAILLPSREIAPMYVPWTVVTEDGQVRTGIKAISGGIATAAHYIDSEGKPFSIPLVDIQLQKQSTVSIMPAGLEKTLTMEEFRDLLKFLEAERSLASE